MRTWIRNVPAYAEEMFVSLCSPNNPPTSPSRSWPCLRRSAPHRAQITGHRRVGTRCTDLAWFSGSCLGRSVCAYINIYKTSAGGRNGGPPLQLLSNFSELVADSLLFMSKYFEIKSFSLWLLLFY